MSLKKRGWVKYVTQKCKLFTRTAIDIQRIATQQNCEDNVLPWISARNDEHQQEQGSRANMHMMSKLDCY